MVIIMQMGGTIVTRLAGEHAAVRRLWARLGGAGVLGGRTLWDNSQMRTNGNTAKNGIGRATKVDEKTIFMWVKEQAVSNIFNTDWSGRGEKWVPTR